MNLQQIVSNAKDKGNFRDLNGFVKFCAAYLNYAADNLQAIIVSQNENHYRFYQYDKNGDFQITRPINSNLMLDNKAFGKASKEYLSILKTIKTTYQDLRQSFD